MKRGAVTDDVKGLQSRDQGILDGFRGIGMVVGQQRVVEGGDFEERLVQLAEVGFREALVIVEDSDLELGDLNHGCKES